MPGYRGCIGDIPDIALFHVLLSLDYKNVSKSKCVSKTWADLISNNVFWKEKFEMDFGEPGDECVDFEREYVLEHKVRFGDPRVTELWGHAGAIYCIRCSGSTMVSGSYDGTVRVWDLNTMQCSRWFKTASMIKAIALHGANVIAGTSVGDIYMWNLTSGELVSTWRAHANGVADICIISDHFITRGRDGNVKIWDGCTSKCLRALDVDTATSLHVRGREIICGLFDGRIYVYMKAGSVLRTLQANNVARFMCASSKHIIITSSNGNVQVLDRGAGAQVATIPGAGQCFYYDTRKLMCKTRSSVGLWDARNWMAIRTINLDHVTYCHYARGKMFVGFLGGSIRVYDFNG